jgi:hypothetical protein
MENAEFNVDGSLKLPDRIIKKREDDEKIFKERPALKIQRNQTSPTTPLTCELIIEASEHIRNPDRILSLFNTATGKFRHLANLSIIKTDERKYLVKIVSGQFRCSWCRNFKVFLSEELVARIIDFGSCLEFTSSRRD